MGWMNSPASIHQHVFFNELFASDVIDHPRLIGGGEHLGAQRGGGLHVEAVAETGEEDRSAHRGGLTRDG